MTATILIADDSAVVRAVLRRQLEADGHTVIEANDGAEALRLCAEVHPDVVLLDVEMPVLDGHLTLAALKADEALRDIPVVFLTGRVDTADVVAGLQAGAHDYLRKPFEANELRARVSTALRTRALQSELLKRMAELEVVSRVDMLTGLHNRRHLDDQLRGSISAARRHGRTVAVLMVDVDHFKHVNDGHGHAAGDTVLQEVAVRLKASTRTEDAVGRWGGEEFLAILTETPREAVGLVAERMRRAIAATPFIIAEGKAVQVTVSIGYVCGDDNAETLISRADDAMYSAKAAGRNRIEAAADTSEPDVPGSTARAMSAAPIEHGD